MYLYRYVCIYTATYVFIPLRMYLYRYVCICTATYVFIPLHMYLYRYICIYTATDVGSDSECLSDKIMNLCVVGLLIESWYLQLFFVVSIFHFFLSLSVPLCSFQIRTRAVFLLLLFPLSGQLRSVLRSS
jgi:hypothetical protein